MSRSCPLTTLAGDGATANGRPEPYGVRLGQLEARDARRDAIKASLSERGLLTDALSAQRDCVQFEPVATSPSG